VRVRLPDTFRSFEIDLAAAPGAAAGATAARGLCLELDEAALERKLTAAHEYVEMAAEVDAALERWGASAFRLECFRETSLDPLGPLATDTAPYYERHGDLRQAEGTYAQVIRYREHIRPLHEALRLHAKTARCPA
jgi:hypothetical protein